MADTIVGDSKFYDFEKHKRNWFDCKHVLEKHNDMPRIDWFVKMFLNSISESRLDQEKVQLMRPGSAGLNEFTVCTTQLSHVLGNSKKWLRLGRRNAKSPWLKPVAIAITIVIVEANARKPTIATVVAAVVMVVVMAVVAMATGIPRRVLKKAP